MSMSSDPSSVDEQRSSPYIGEDEKLTVVTPQCAVCSERGKLKICASCRKISYCSREHQLQDWSQHKTLCNQLKSERINSLSDDMATLAVNRRAEQMALAAASVNAAVTSNAAVSAALDLSKTSTGAERLQNNIQLNGDALNTTHSDSIADTSLCDESLSFPSEDTLTTHLPSDLPTHCTQSWLNKTSNDIAGCLKQYGIAVVNNFLGSSLGDKLYDEAKRLHDDEKMFDGETTKPGNIRVASSSPPGDDDTSDQTQKKRYRMDKIAWVETKEQTNPEYMSISALTALLDNIVQSAQEKLKPHIIQGRTSAMVACYPGHGSCYVKHVDNPSKDGRLLTCIYYLNKKWNCKVDGGMLRIYPQGTSRVASIEPLMDRLLVFWSDTRNPHEVLPAHRTRFAVTIWYFDREERAEAIRQATIRHADREERAEAIRQATIRHAEQKRKKSELQ